MFKPLANQTLASKATLGIVVCSQGQEPRREHMYLIGYPWVYYRAVGLITGSLPIYQQNQLDSTLGINDVVHNASSRLRSATGTRLFSDKANLSVEMIEDM